MASKVNVNLSEIVRNKIHHPRDKQGMVYYIPKHSSTTLTQEEKRLTQDKIYMGMQSKYLNSPTNIRRIWISHSCVTVEYYAGYRKKGSLSELCAQRSISEPIKKYTEDMLRYNSLNQSQVSISKIPNVEFTGSVFTGVRHPWTCNNVEEIYFDWTALLSKDSLEILERMPGFNSKADYLNMIAAFLNGEEKYEFVETDLARQLFLGVDKDEISKTFKRLKSIVFISKLDNMMGLIPTTTDKFSLHEPKSKSSIWINNPVVLSKAQELNCAVWGSIQRDKTLDNTSIDNFTIKNNHYVFDDEVLKPKIEAYVNKVKDLIRNNAGTDAYNEAEDAQVSPVGSVEELLDSYYSTYGADVARAIFKAAILEVSNKERNMILAGMVPVKSAQYLAELKK